MNEGPGPVTASQNQKREDRAELVRARPNPLLMPLLAVIEETSNQECEAQPLHCLASRRLALYCWFIVSLVGLVVRWYDVCGSIILIK